MAPDELDPAASSREPADWYAHIKGESKGPFDEQLLEEMLTSGLIEPETPVARPGDTGWQPVSSVIRPSSPASPPPQPPGTAGGDPSLVTSMISDLLETLSPKVKKTAGLCGIALVVLFVITSFQGESNRRGGNQTPADDGRFWEDQAEKLAQDATGGSNHCARCGGTGQITNSGRATNWNAHPDPSERLRAGADSSGCRSCSGQGTISTQSGHVVTCPDCSGRGQASSRPCEACGGTGRWR